MPAINAPRRVNRESFINALPPDRLRDFALQQSVNFEEAKAHLRVIVKRLRWMGVKDEPFDIEKFLDRVL